MKNTLILIGLLAVTNAAQAQNEPPCDCYALQGTISSNTQLSEDCYRLIGCVNVTSGNTLTIDAGTKIFADDMASLVIDRGAYIIAQGTSANPIVFTTDQNPGSRTPGYWKGLTIAGDAVDNDGNLTLTRNCANIPAGGSDDNDSSGVLKYVQIHFAGGQESGETEVNGLTLASVGRKTVLEHIQVTESATDGLAFLGGTVNGKYLVTYNVKGNDITTNFGYRGKIQFGLAIRLDANAHLASGSNAILSRNDFSGSGNTPITKPIFSNMTILGPAYCGGTGLSSDFKNGVLFAENTEARIYNSLIAGWPNGFRIEDLATIQNANDNGTLFFAVNSFYNNVSSDFTHSGSWTGAGCEASMSDWINFGNVSGNICAMVDNETFSTGLGYHSSICGTYCTTAPTLTMTSSSMAAADFSASDLNDPFFTSVSYRGSLTSTDNFTPWTEWCTQIDYCPDNLMKQGNTGSSREAQFSLRPNPATKSVTASFTSPVEGAAVLSILDPVTGRTLSETSFRLASAGHQERTLDISALKTGNYIVTIRFSNGSTTTTHLSVK